MHSNVQVGSSATEMNPSIRCITTGFTRLTIGSIRPSVTAIPMSTMGTIRSDASRLPVLSGLAVQTKFMMDQFSRHLSAVHQLMGMIPSRTDSITRRCNRDTFLSSDDSRAERASADQCCLNGRKTDLFLVLSVWRCETGQFIRNRSFASFRRK